MALGKGVKHLVCGLLDEVPLCDIVGSDVELGAPFGVGIFLLVTFYVVECYIWCIFFQLFQEDCCVDVVFGECPW